MSNDIEQHFLRARWLNLTAEQPVAGAAGAVGVAASAFISLCLVLFETVIAYLISQSCYVDVNNHV